jgi:hypothetical protein
VDQEVSQTLAALERKLAELERELGRVNQDGIASQDSSTGFARASPPSSLTAAPDPSPGLTGAGSPSPGPAATPEPGPSPGILIDEAVEQRYSMEARETVFGEIPATKDERQSIDLAELVRFKEKMQTTLQGLIDEYSELLSLKPPTDA